MGCCGQKRAEAANSTRRASDPAAQPPVPRTATAPSQGEAGRLTERWQAGSALPGSVMVRYLGRSSVRVPGPVTGRAYLFSETSPVQAVAAQDAPALLGTPYFRRVDDARAVGVVGWP